MTIDSHPLCTIALEISSVPDSTPPESIAGSTWTTDGGVLDTRELYEEALQDMVCDAICFSDRIILDPSIHLGLDASLIKVISDL